MGRGLAWTSKDDVLLCEAWLHVSQDPLAATDQKMATFWEKIMAYIKLKKGTIKSTRSSQSRFHFLSSTVQKFAGVYSQQQAYAASGTSNMDVERAALEVYRAEAPGGKSFDYRECWLRLKEWPKWQSTVKGAQVEGDKNQEDASNVEPVVSVDPPETPDTINSETMSVRGRPIGVKKTKQLNQQSTDLKRQLEAVASTNALAIKRARILQQQVALGYFRLNTNDVPIELRDRFERTRDKLLNELDANLDQIPQANIPQPQPQGNFYAASPASVATGDEHDVTYPTFEGQVPEHQNEEYVPGTHNEGYDGYTEVGEGIAVGSPEMHQTRIQD